MLVCWNGFWPARVRAGGLVTGEDNIAQTSRRTARKRSKMNCAHQHVTCLNPFETIRKYRCAECDAVFICSCNQEWALMFLPHQTRSGSEFGTRLRVPVTGFVPALCSDCRSEPPQRYPLAAIYGRKGKVERFYWREIRRDSYLAMLAYLKGRGEKVADVFEFRKRFPGVEDELYRAAKKTWQVRHRQTPKYDTREPTEASFLARVSVPRRDVIAEYVQVLDRDRVVGKWLTENGQLVTAEKLAAGVLEKLGYQVLACERKLISVCVATFLVDVVQDPSDPLQQVVMRGSTVNWKRGPATPQITFLLPADFGSAEYYLRRKTQFENGLDLLRESSDLLAEFDRRTERAKLLRDYLWVADDDAKLLARSALAIVPRDTIVAALQWAIASFWKRQPGWPDLFVWNEQGYRFCEVKSPHDELSLEQMQWFEWAIHTAHVPCEITRVKPKANT